MFHSSAPRSCPSGSLMLVATLLRSKFSVVILRKPFFLTWSFLDVNPRKVRLAGYRKRRSKKSIQTHLFANVNTRCFQPALKKESPALPAADRLLKAGGRSAERITAENAALLFFSRFLFVFSTEAKPRAVWGASLQRRESRAGRRKAQIQLHRFPPRTSCSATREVGGGTSCVGGKPTAREIETYLLCRCLLSVLWTKNKVWNIHRERHLRIKNVR